MLDEARSNLSKPRKVRPRILVVQNGGAESSSSSEDEHIIPQSTYEPYSYQPPAHSTSSNLSFNERHPSPHHPPPLTTNNLPDHRHYPSSRSNPSNPALSSPSSTSSPAFESTPPPSTPGQSNPPDLSSEGTLRQEPVIVSYPDGDESASQLPGRPGQTGLLTRLRSHLPQRPTHGRRSSGNRPQSSPTTSVPESFTSQASASRASPGERITLLVTTDAEHLVIVDITGAQSPAFIRERIFAKLQISDENIPHYSIYKTEIGKFAIGEALNDDQLWDLYRERGDERGSIKLLVSHSHATVHESATADAKESSPTVNTIPPPVLPQQMYAPLRPRRASHSRRGSMSSASERPEAAGYEASVSDDLDHGERELRRPPHRSPPQPYPPPRQPLPPRPRSPSGYGRSQSPGGIVSPDRSRIPSGQMPPMRQERPRPPNTLPTPPMQTHSPEVSRFQESMPPPPQPPFWHARSGSDAAVDRERIMQMTDATAEASWRAMREKTEREKLAASRREGQVRKESGLKRSKAYHEGGENARHRTDEWTLVAANGPSSGYRRDRPTTPQDPRPSPSRQPLPAYPLNIPQHPRGPPPAPPGGGEPRERGKRQAGKMVPDHYVIAYKGPQNPGKGDPNPAPQSPPGSAWPPRMMAKSMNDLRAVYKAQGSGGSSQSARRPPPASPLPMSTKSVPPSGGAPSGLPYGYPQMFDTSPGYHGESATMMELGLPKSYEGNRGPLASPTNTYYQGRQQNPYSSTSQPSSSPYLGLSSAGSSQEPYQRPHSSLENDPSTSPYRPNRHLQSPNGSEVPSETMIPRVSPIVSTHYPSSSTSGIAPNLPYREELHPSAGFGPRPLPSHPPYPRHTATESLPTMDRPAQLTRMSRTPPRSPISARTPPMESREPERKQLVDTALPVQRTLSSLPLQEDEPSSAENTIRHDDAIRYAGMLERGTSSIGSDTLVPSSASSRTLIPRKASPVSLLDMSGMNLSEEGTYMSTKTVSSDESDGGGSGTYWAVPPQKASRPVLAPIDTESPPSGTRVPSREAPRAAPPNFPPAVPGYIPEPPPARPLGRSGNVRKDQRTSRFDTNQDSTWAPRPPPEEVFERLQDYFPEHDVDEPVIEAASGGTSPTSAEPDPLPQAERRFKHKKSIRVVAAEHKRRVDRTSRAEASANNVTLRKRNTKLWGSRLEEVTTDHAHGHHEVVAGTTDASPGPAKPIFRWVRGELIGKGTYGKVYLALNATTGEMIAVKQVEMPRTASDKDDTRQITVVEALKSESETLKDLDHPNIVQYLGFEETPTFLSIFLEYVPGGSIASCLRKYGKFDEEVTKSFTGQILSGLEYLHSKGILHRDLKADNILVETSGICKISDFGISKRTDDINMAAYTSMQGTVFWMAPEVIDAKKKGYNSKIDIWSVGCVVFEMWTGQRPWSGKEAMAVLLQLYQTKQGPPVPQECTLSQLADDFRQQCFATNPDERPTAAELRKHPYLELQPDWMFNGFK